MRAGHATAACLERAFRQASEHVDLRLPLDGGCSILSKQTLGDERIHQRIAVEMAISTALGAPVFHDDEPFAVLMAMNRAGGGSFSEEDETALNSYAREVADTLWRAAAS